MPEEKFEGIGVRTAVDRVESAYNQIYGPDNVVVQNILGNKRIKARKVNDYVDVKDADGGVVLDYSGVQPDTINEVKDRMTGGGSDYNSETSGMVESEQDMAVQSGGVKRPYSHAEAGYVERGDPDFEPSHERCKSCAWYDNDGSCRIVDDIDEDGYCDFYADALISAHEHDDYVEINLVVWGEEADFDESDIEDLSEKIKDRLQ